MTHEQAELRAREILDVAGISAPSTTLIQAVAAILKVTWEQGYGAALDKAIALMS